MSPPQLIPPTSPGQVFAGDERLIYTLPPSDGLRRRPHLYKIKTEQIKQSSCSLCSAVSYTHLDVYKRQTYAYWHGSGLKLHVDNRFDKIYDYWKCKGDFGSCMTGRNRDEFYACLLYTSRCV